MPDNNLISSPLDREIVDTSLSVRSKTCLEKAKVKTIRELVQYDEIKLVSLKNFGRKSLLEINKLLEDVDLNIGMSIEEIHEYEINLTNNSVDVLSGNLYENDSSIIFEVIPWMSPVIAKFIEKFIEDQEGTVSDAIGSMGHYGSKIKIKEVLSNINFELFGNIFEEQYNKLSDDHQMIVKKRIYSYPPQSLNELGNELKLTRERIRQLEKNIKESFSNRFNKIDVLIQARTVRTLLGKIIDLQSARYLVDSLINTSRNPITAFFALLNISGPYTINKNWGIREDVIPRIESLKTVLRNHKDRIGRIDPLIIARETAGLFNNKEEEEEFLIDYLKLNRIFGEWVTRDSDRNRIFLSLFKIGKPATKEEIAAYSGIKNLMRISSYLTSNDFICRADKDRWGFKEWIEDPYNGIAREIEDQIHKCGGKVMVKDLLDELPSKFGVSENSVRSYLSTPKFIVKDGYVRCATQDEICSTYFGDIEDVPNAIQLKDGRWGARIKVENRFLAGRSASIPAPIAWECGMKPGDSYIVPVEGSNCEVSLIWRTDNTNLTVDLGRIALILKERKFEPGSEFVIIPSTQKVNILSIDEVSELQKQDRQKISTSVDTLLKTLFTK